MKSRNAVDHSPPAADPVIRGPQASWPSHELPTAIGLLFPHGKPGAELSGVLRGLALAAPPSLLLWGTFGWVLFGR